MLSPMLVLIIAAAMARSVDVVMVTFSSRCFSARRRQVQIQTLRQRCRAAELQMAAVFSSCARACVCVARMLCDKCWAGDAAADGRGVMVFAVVVGVAFALLLLLGLENTFCWNCVHVMTFQLPMEERWPAVVAMIETFSLEHRKHRACFSWTDCLHLMQSDI